MLIECSKIGIYAAATLYAIYRMWKPVIASDGKASRTLTGMYVSAIFIFATVAVDTLNDRGVVVVNQAAISGASATVKKSTRSRRRTVAVKDSGTARSVIKEKYYILYSVFFMFAILYLIGHKNEKMTRMFVWILMALRKMNPFEYDNPMDIQATKVLSSNPDNPDVRAWFVQYMLAKKGVSSTPTHPEEPPEMPGGAP